MRGNDCHRGRAETFTGRFIRSWCAICLHLQRVANEDEVGSTGKAKIVIVEMWLGRRNGLYIGGEVFWYVGPLIDQAKFFTAQHSVANY